MIRDSNHSPKLIVPYKLRTRYLHQAHEGTNHPGVTRMRELLSNYWWEFKNRGIKSYVDSWDTCAKCKGNYGKRTRWPIGHCKRDRRPSEPNSKGKRYTLTILDSFSRHFTAIPCARDRAIDAACGLYHFFFSPQRNTTHSILWLWHSFYRWSLQTILCQMSIIQELHCLWRPQSPGNIERQHRTMKNALYMLCEDSPPQHWFAQTTLKGAWKKWSRSLWYANKCSTKASLPSRRPC